MMLVHAVRLISKALAVCIASRCEGPRGAYTNNAKFLPTLAACLQNRREAAVQCKACHGRDWVEHRSVCSDCATTYSWFRQGEQIKLRRLTKAWSIGTPLDPAWLRLLEPNSIDVDGDPATQHLLWCNDAGCAIARRGNSWIALLLSTLNIRYDPRTKADIDRDLEPTMHCPYVGFKATYV